MSLSTKRTFVSPRKRKSPEEESRERGFFGWLRSQAVKTKTQVAAQIQRKKVHKQLQRDSVHDIVEGTSADAAENAPPPSPRCTNPRLNAMSQFDENSFGVQTAGKISNAFISREYPTDDPTRQSLEWEEHDGMRRTLASPASPMLTDAQRRPINFSAEEPTNQEFYGNADPVSTRINRGCAPAMYHLGRQHAVNYRRESMRQNRWDDEATSLFGQNDGGGAIQTRSISEVNNARTRWSSVASSQTSAGSENTGPIARGREGGAVPRKFPTSSARSSTLYRTIESGRMSAPAATGGNARLPEGSLENVSQHGRVPEDAYESRTSFQRFGNGVNMGNNAPLTNYTSGTHVRNPTFFTVGDTLHNSRHSGLFGGVRAAGTPMHVPQDREGSYGTRMVASGKRIAQYGGVQAAGTPVHVPKDREGSYGTRFGAAARDGTGALSGGVNSWGVAPRGKDRTVENREGSFGPGGTTRGGLFGSLVSTNAFFGSRMSKTAALLTHLLGVSGGAAHSVTRGGKASYGSYTTAGRTNENIVQLPVPSGGSGMPSRLIREAFYNVDRLQTENLDTNGGDALQLQQVPSNDGIREPIRGVMRQTHPKSTSSSPKATDVAVKNKQQTAHQGMSFLRQRMKSGRIH